MSEQNYMMTKGGLTPDQNGLPYTITTEKIESYLQQKLNIVCKEANIPQMTLRIYTIEMSKNFFPMIITLPKTALKSSENKENEDYEPGEEVFDPEQNDSYVELRPELYKLFKIYVYSTADESAFFSEDWRRLTKVSRMDSSKLKKLRTAKVMEVNDTVVVVFMLDPIRVFHDMLSDRNMKKDFRFDITGIKKLREDNYRYSVRTYPGRNKKPKGNDIFAILKRRLKF